MVFPCPFSGGGAGKGNLRACMESFAARQGDGGTWHLQDDVLLCRDFVRRAREHDSGVVYGFCCEAFTDDPEMTGRVPAADAWMQAGKITKQSYENWCSKAQAVKKDLADGKITPEVCLERLKED